MRHRSIAAAIAMAILFLGTARQADAQVYVESGSAAPVSYTSYYPGTWAYPSTGYVYPASGFTNYSYPRPWGWNTGLPYSYGSPWARNTWNGNYNYRYNYGWNGYNYRYNYGWSGWRGRGWR
jgi:hypothetical protein